jgi:thiamine-monophosphate kinase
MKEKQLSEIHFIEEIHKENRIFNHTTSMLGIGDDCSVQEIGDKQYLLNTTDLMLEDVHFLRSKITASDLGGKLVEVNVSDIAAMGGVPTSAFFSAALPSDFTRDDCRQLIKGLNEKLREYAIDLLGGDTTHSSEKIVLNLHVQGLVAKDHIKLRSTAKVGDIVCLTGIVGDSAIGLEYIKNQSLENANKHYFLKQHHSPKAHLREGIWLGKHSEVHAMMDVSDGVFQDIQKMTSASQVGAEIHFDKYPFSKKGQEFFLGLSKEKYYSLINGGEDYCLLLTVKPEKFLQLSQNFKEEFGSPLYRIGEIILSPQVKFYEDGKQVLVKNLGFYHLGGE